MKDKGSTNHERDNAIAGPKAGLFGAFAPRLGEIMLCT